MSMADRLGRPPAVVGDRRPRITKCLDTFRESPIIGIEYLIEMYENNYQTYECVLCDKTKLRTHSNVMAHLTSFEHRIAFLVAHFPKTIQPINELLAKSPKPSEWLRERIEFICGDIEKRKGRLSVAVLKNGDFKANRDTWVQRIKDGFHFRENKIIIAFDPSDLKRELQSVGIAVSDRSRSRSPFERRPRMRRGRNSKWGPANGPGLGSPNYSFGRSPDENHLVLEEYHRQYAQMRSEIMDNQERHQSDPQSHPMYPSEWNLFWTNRREELTQAGKDPYEHDFSREWSIYWVERMPHLDDEEIARRETEIRTSLNIPLDMDIPQQIQSNDHGEPSLEVRNDSFFEESPMNQPHNGHLPKMGLEHENAAELDQRRMDDQRRGHERERDQRRRNNSERGPRNEQARDSRMDRNLPEERFEKTPKSAEHHRHMTDHSNQGAQRPSEAPRHDESHHNSVETPRDKWLPIGTDAKNHGNRTNKPPSAPRFERDSVSQKPKTQRRDALPTDNQRPTGDGRIKNNPTNNETRQTRFENLEESEAVLLGEDEPTQDPVTVISVLRLLAAFEDILGNRLGPQVVDLLSKAVALEKVRPNLADDLLMSSENSILLDTVKEKMKGLLLTGVVEAFKVPAVQKVMRHVNKINQIINLRVRAEEKKAAKAMKDAKIHLEVSLAKEKEIQNERNKAEFRADVRKQLLASMSLQGKAITPEQLNALTNVYIEKHTPTDTPYLFGLQMGSKFPDIPLEEKHRQLQRPDQSARYGMNSLGQQSNQNEPSNQSSYDDTFASGSGSQYADQQKSMSRWNDPSQSSLYQMSDQNSTFPDNNYQQSNYQPVMNIRPNLTEQRPIIEDHHRPSGNAAVSDYYNGSNSNHYDHNSSSSQYGVSFTDRTVTMQRNNHEDHHDSQYHQYDMQNQVDQFHDYGQQHPSQLDAMYDNRQSGQRQQQQQQPNQNYPGNQSRSARNKAARKRPNVKNVH